MSAALLGSSPSPSPSGSVLPEDVLETAVQACQEGARICRLVTDLTGQRRAGEWAELLVGTPLRILLILLIAFVSRLLIHRAIAHVVDRIAADRPVDESPRRRRWSYQGVLEQHSPLASERRVQRARTMGTVLRSVSTGAIATIAVLMILAEIGLDIGPLLASAGILGVALGFGAQSLVKDFLSGLFMIIEDQYGVGDVVDLGEAVGTIEAVGLRVTRLRSVDGTLWYVPNGQIQRVGNQSQGWARAVLDIAVAYGEDVTRVQGLLAQVGADLHADPEWAPLVMEAPEVWGVEALSADSVVVRLVVKTVPLEQWRVARELRRRIKAVFDAEGIEIPFPQRTVWMRDERERGVAGAGTEADTGAVGS